MSEANMNSICRRFYRHISTQNAILAALSMAFALNISSCGQNGPGIESAWSNPEEIFTLEGHTQDILRAMYSPDGLLIVTLSADSRFGWPCWCGEGSGVSTECESGSYLC
jgi:WD40 repeat protein